MSPIAERQSIELAARRAKGLQGEAGGCDEAQCETTVKVGPNDHDQQRPIGRTALLVDCPAEHAKPQDKAGISKHMRPRRKIVEAERYGTHDHDVGCNRMAMTKQEVGQEGNGQSHS